MTDITQRSIIRATFTLERTYPHPPARVFGAFANKEEKAKWFGGGDPAQTQWDFDFWEGGREYHAGPFMGHVHAFDSRYLDIVENERIVHSYTMSVDGVKLSASLTSIEFEAVGDGSTRFRMIEHGAYFDGHEDPSVREEGTAGLLDALGAVLDESREG